MKLTHLLAGVLLCVCITAGAFIDTTVDDSRVSYQGHQVLRFTISNDLGLKNQVLAFVEQYRLDLWAAHPEWVDVRMDKATVPRAVENGIPFRIMIEDLEAHIVDERQSIAMAGSFVGNVSAFFDTYRTYEEFNSFIDQLASNYPHLVTKKTIGKTVEGRSINGFTITAKSANTNKINIVFNGGQHAREWIGPITTAFISNQLVSLYGQDDQVTSFLDNVEFSIFPIINADGYAYSWNKERMWRKNRRENKDSWFGCYGVDTNRNWGNHWGGGGASPDTCSETYRGPRAFSEPEQTSLADYMKTLTNLHGYIDWHSYSQLILGPWGWSTTEKPKDVDTQNELASLAVKAIKDVHGKVYTYGPSGPTLYVSSGGSNDWVYGDLDVTYSYVVELRDTGRYGFVLPPSEIIPTGEESFAAVRVFTSYILSHLDA